MRMPARIPYPRAAAFAAAVFALYLLLGFLVAPRLIERFIPGFVADTLQRKASVGAVSVNPFILKVEVNDFALSERDGAPIAGFRRLSVNFELSSLVRWAWTFSDIELDGLDVTADIAPGGRFNIAALIDDLPKRERDGGGAPPRLLLQRVALRDGKITFSDRSDPTPASTSLGPVSFELHDISTIPDRHGTYAVNARLAEGGDIGWRGEIALQPLSSQGEISIKGVKPLTAWRFLRDELGVDEPHGEFDFGARYRVSYERGVPQAAIEGLRIAGRNIALTANGAKAPILSLAGVRIEGGRFDLAARELVIPVVAVNDGSIAAEVDASGRINWQKLVKTGDRVDEARTAAPPPGKPWKTRVESLQLKGVAVDYTDRSRARPIRMAAGAVNTTLAALVELGADGT